MQEVSIYIDVNFTGYLKSGTGTYNTVLEYIASDGAPRTREYYHGIKNTTKNRTAIKACIGALDHLIKPCKVKLTINNSYIVQAAGQKWYSMWVKSSVNAKGDKVKNIDLWQQLAELLDKHEVTFEYGLTNPYSAYMYSMARKAQIDYEDDGLIK